MRVSRFLAVGLLLSASASVAQAVDPNDQPWDEIDRVLRENPPPATPSPAAQIPAPAASPAPVAAPALIPSPATVAPAAAAPVAPTAAAATPSTAEAANATQPPVNRAKNLKIRPEDPEPPQAPAGTSNVAVVSEPEVPAASTPVEAPKPPPAALTPAPAPAPASTPTAAPAAATPVQPPAPAATAAPATPAATAAPAAPAAPTPPAIAVTPPQGEPTNNAGTAPQEVPAATAKPAVIPAAAPTVDPNAVSPPAVIANGDVLYLPVARYLDSKPARALNVFPEADRKALVKFYNGRMGQAVWISKQGLTPEAQGLIAGFRDADNWGMKSADYKVPDIVPASQQTPASDDQLTDAEVRLSLAALAYARHAKGDRITDPATQLSSYLDRKPAEIDRVLFLQTLAWSHDKAAYMRTFQPKHPQFELLRQKLLALRTENAGNPPQVPDGPKLMPGKSHPQIAIIRQVLKVAAPTATADGKPADATYFDDALANAVVAFKQKKGLEPANSAITTPFRRALNSANSVTEAKILANMEEWRWMPEDLGYYYVLVNIPEFLVRVVKNGDVIHQERIVTGRYQTQTPIFSNMMRTIVFQPRWNVPMSIKMKELLPGLRAGRNSVAGQGLVMTRNGRKINPMAINWNSTDIRYYDVYQPPGGGNALGVVKFLFPNKHAVYLHDTPSKSLFNENVRAFSHGCMRVRNPVQLAEVLLREDKGWDKSIVTDFVTNGPEENEIQLDRPVPVHVTYFTAWVNNEGEVETFDDVYGHEKRIQLALAGRWNEIVKNRDHLLPPDDVPVARRDYWYGDDDDDFRTARRGRNGEVVYVEQPQKKKKSSNFFKQLFGGL